MKMLGKCWILPKIELKVRFHGEVVVLEIRNSAY